MNSRMRVLLGILLVAAGLFYDKVVKKDEIKLSKPEASVVDVVNELPEIPDKVDSNKLSGTFLSMSEGVPDTRLESNLQVQYYLDFVGRNTLGNELVSESGEKKYPDFSPAAASAIEKTIGPQNETDPLTEEEKQNLEKLFYGFAWKLYNSLNDDVFEEYKSKAKSAIAEYNSEDDTPDVIVNTDCICDGKGYVVHGDGHKTDCPCIESGETCEHDPPCKQKGDQPPPLKDETITNTTPKKKKGLFKWLKH